MYYPSGGLIFGEKARHLKRLREEGFSVPNFIVVCDEALQEILAPAENLISTLRSSLASRDMRDEYLEKIRTFILESRIPDDLMSWIDNFLKQLDGGSVAVRSSAISEDTAAASFAGQYDTFLNVKGADEVCIKLKLCWASLFKPNVWDYALKAQVDEKIGMGVVIMQQIDSVVSGVSFSHLNGQQKCVIEASFGQGEAVVGGLVTPDMWVVARDGKLERSQIAVKRYALRPSKSGSGLIRECLEQSSSNIACLTPSHVEKVRLLTEKIASARQGPCDIEWCFSPEGNLVVLQARPITKEIHIHDYLELSWCPPGPGSWIRDTSHLPRPVTKIFESTFEDVTRAWMTSSASAGALLSHIVLARVNAWTYVQLVPASPENIPELLQQSKKYFDAQGWKHDWKIWRQDIVPKRVNAQESLKKVHVSGLSNLELLDHWRNVVSNYKESLFFHHRYNFSCYTSGGIFLYRGGILTGKSCEELLTLLEGFAHMTRGPWSDAFCRPIVESFKSSNRAKRILMEASGEQGLEALKSDPNVGPLLSEWLNKYDHFVIGGMDASQPTLRESPDFILSTFRSMVDSPGISNASKRVAEKEQEILKGICDDSSRAEFLELLAATREMADWRDERAFVNDVPACGLLRFTLREIGSRVAQMFSKSIASWEWLLDCSPKEVESIFLHGITPSFRAELENRRRLRLLPNKEPPFLGDAPSPPPDPSGLPPGAREMESARGLFISRIFSPPELGALKENLLQGIGASGGTVEGTARILLDDSSLSAVQPGDIAIVESAGTAFSSILPILGAIGKSDFST